MSAKRTQIAPNDLVGLRDADDDMALEVAVNGQADATLNQLINVGGGGETLGPPDRGLLHRASCACGDPEGAESPQAGRCW
jgi:hypothetical protein